MQQEGTHKKYWRKKKKNKNKKKESSTGDSVRIEAGDEE